MKKLLATLLSMLMLCTMMPFATVSAAGDYYIELVADAEEVNAGDEITVEVSLYGHESVGLIAALIELGYDHDVFEPVTYYDEDEEMWMHSIEVGPKFSASSNKYITFGPIDEETGAASNCAVLFKRATATATQAVKTNLFYTATFKVKDDAPSGTYTIDVIGYNDKNLVMHGNTYDTWTWEPITITVNGSEPSCEHEYTYACDKVCALCGELTNEAAEHSITAVEAKAPTCSEEGNVAYWSCEHCGSAWLDAECTLSTNLLAVVLPVTDHVYDNDTDADCNVCGEVRLVAYSIFAFGGASIRESSDGKSGLTFKFNLSDKVTGLALKQGSKYRADYSNTYVSTDSLNNYKLVTMGAVVANMDSGNTLDDVDDGYVQNIVANKLCLEETENYFAIRIIDIPKAFYGQDIFCTPYFIYENAEGEQVVVYGAEQVASVNSVSNGIV